MFDSSRKVRTAIEAVVYIALNGAASPVHSRDLTRYQGIAPRYLEPVLQRLGRAGIVYGIRGPRGGYVLGRERRRISVGEIVRTVMEAEAPKDRAAQQGGGAIGRQIVDPLWQEHETQFFERLDEISVEDLCRKAVESEIIARNEQPLDFAI